MHLSSFISCDNTATTMSVAQVKEHSMGQVQQVYKSTQPPE